MPHRRPRGSPAPAYCPADTAVFVQPSVPNMAEGAPTPSSRGAPRSPVRKPGLVNEPGQSQVRGCRRRTWGARH